MSDPAVKEFYANEKYLNWKGFRLLAIDGSTSNLPNHPTVKEDFGSVMTGCKNSVESSMARISLFYDVLNCITLDALIAGQSVSEIGLMNRHLASQKLMPGDLLLTDRGYSSNALMYELQHKGMDFCIRMRSHWNEVRDFANSNETSRIVQFLLPRKDKALKSRYNSNLSYVNCRLVAITLESGEKEILCTSLLDEEKYPIEEMKTLYHFRWNIEEAYKLLKVRLQLSNYSGKTSNSVKQDFFAKIFMMNMCAVMSFPVEERLRKENQTNRTKHNQQLNKTNILSTLKESWIALWLKNKAKRVLIAFDDILKRTREVVRPNRKFERKKYRHPDRKPSPPYKAI